MPAILNDRTCTQKTDAADHALQHACRVETITGLGRQVITDFEAQQGEAGRPQRDQHVRSQPCRFIRTLPVPPDQRADCTRYEEPECDLHQRSPFRPNHVHIGIEASCVPHPSS